MARKRPEGLRDWGDADAALRQIGDLERSIEAAEARMQEAIAQAKDAAAAKIKEFKGKIKPLALLLQVFCQERKADLGPKKSKLLNFGLVGFRWSTKVMLPRDKATLAALVSKLKDMDQRQCLQIKETILKDEVKKLDEFALGQLESRGLRKDSGDSFFYEVNREKIQEAA